MALLLKLNLYKDCPFVLSKIGGKKVTLWYNRPFLNTSIKIFFYETGQH